MNCKINNIAVPEDFTALARVSLGEEYFRVLQRALAEEPAVTSVRLNPDKILSLKYEPRERPEMSANNLWQDPSAEVKTDFLFWAASLFPEEMPRRVLWCDKGFYLARRPVFTLDPLFHAGVYYVQEASSMFLDLIRNAVNRYEAESDRFPEECSGAFWSRPLRVLDLCAAPGGKSTHLAGFLPEEGLLVCNEVIKSRAAILADNMARWGNCNVMVTNNDPRDFASLGEYFDFILTDAPCSGEGMFRKDPAATAQWSIENVKLCAQRQQRILADIWKALKPGGYLVYSTCTFNRYENDGALKFLREKLGAEILDVFPTDKHFRISHASSGIISEPMGISGGMVNKNAGGNHMLETTNFREPLLKGPESASCGIVRTAEGGYQFIPGCVEGEGQFFALVRKPETENGRMTVTGTWKQDDTAGNGKSREFRIAGKERYEYRMKPSGKDLNPRDRKGGRNRESAQKMNAGRNCPYVLPGYILETAGELVKAYPCAAADEMKFLESRLRSIYSGAAVAVIKGKDFVPHPDLAFSRALRREAFFTVEISRADALKFLSREALHFPDAPAGYLLLVYRGTGLGFVKNLGNRSNNLFPAVRRIRMDINRE